MRNFLFSFSFESDFRKLGRHKLHQSEISIIKKKTKEKKKLFLPGKNILWSRQNRLKNKRLNPYLSLWFASSLSSTGEPILLWNVKIITHWQAWNKDLISIFCNNIKLFICKNAETWICLQNCVCSVCSEYKIFLTIYLD